MLASKQEVEKQDFEQRLLDESNRKSQHQFTAQDNPNSTNLNSSQLRADDLVESKNGIPLLDSTVARQNKSNRMKMSIKLDKAKENTKKRGNLGSSASLPSLFQNKNATSTSSLISSSHTNITRPMLETQAGDQLKESIAAIQNLGVIPSEVKPSRFKSNKISKDELIFFHYNQGKVQVYKLYLEDQSQAKLVGTFNLKKNDSLSAVHLSQTQGKFYILRKHDQMLVESIDNDLSQNYFDTYISREEYQASLNQRDVDPDAFKQLYIDVRSKQIIDEEAKRGGLVPQNFHSRLLDEPHINKNEQQMLRSQKMPEGDIKLIEQIKESQQRLQQQIVNNDRQRLLESQYNNKIINQKQDLEYNENPYQMGSQKGNRTRVRVQNQEDQGLDDKSQKISRSKSREREERQGKKSILKKEGDEETRKRIKKRVQI
eukprot:403331814